MPIRSFNLRTGSLCVGVATAWAVGCSLADLDALNRGGRTGIGGTSASAGATAVGGNSETNPSDGGSGGSENPAGLAGGGATAVASSGAGNASLAGASGIGAAGSNQNGGGTS
ncbi:MAG TPA: hypothetical protein VIV60_32495, partial [Polyangiaceae bacterium]